MNFILISTQSTQAPAPFIQRGFTAIELMVTIVIVSILAALAGPSFKLLVERWRVRQSTDAMINTLYFARGEAIKRGGRVGIQKNAPQTAPGCTLASTNEEWGCGWFVFQDDNGDGRWQSTETKLQSVMPSANITVVHKSGGVSIKVDRNGKMSGLNAKGFIFAPEADGISSPATRGICMSSGGRIKVIEDVPCT